jgi:hypothetical protein
VTTYTRKPSSTGIPNTLLTYLYFSSGAASAHI